MPQKTNYRTASRPRFNRSRNSSSKKRQPKKTYIDPSKFIKSARPVAQEEYIPVNNFSDFAVNNLIKSNIINMGFTKPSPIQDQAIPVGLQGKDIVGIANTGTGKTVAFGVPVLNKLMSDPKNKAIILAPTRELAQQIEQQLRSVGKGSGLVGALLIGGVPITPQIRDLKNNPNIIIGTPGRFKDHIERGTLRLNDCNIVVLDEVDRMLDMGFVDDITDIIIQTSLDRQCLFFSATLDNRVRMIIDSFANEPINITVKSADTSDSIEQNVVRYIDAKSKIDLLHEILVHENTSKAIIFDDTQRMVERLSDELAQRGFKADSIHGGKTQGQRQRVLKSFKENRINVLVATDVAARGIDVSDISHVINYSLPQTYSDYVHRIGRTGRADKTGNALTFIQT